MTIRNECLLTVEDQEWPSCAAPEKTTATLHPSGIDVRVEQISQCGLTFTRRTSCEIQTSGLLNLTCGGPGLSLEEVPFILLSETRRETGVSRVTIERGKRYAIRFTLFTREQLGRLQDFLDACSACSEAGGA